MRFIHTIKSRCGRPIDFDAAELQIRNIAGDFNLCLLYLYGSYAYGAASKLSDIDIGFVSLKELSLDRQLCFIEKLQQIFEDEAVDLVDLAFAPLTLIHRVLKTGQCLYARQLSDRLEFEINKESLYFDAAPLRREYEQALIRRIKNGTFGHR